MKSTPQENTATEKAPRKFEKVDTENALFSLALDILVRWDRPKAMFDKSGKKIIR